MPNLGGTGGGGGAGTSGGGAGSSGNDGGSGGGSKPIPKAGGGVPLPDGKNLEVALENIKTKDDLLKAISAGATIPFDITLKVLENHFANDLKGKLDRGEQLVVNNGVTPEEDKMNE